MRLRTFLRSILRRYSKTPDSTASGTKAPCTLTGGISSYSMRPQPAFQPLSYIRSSGSITRFKRKPRTVLLLTAQAVVCFEVVAREAGPIEDLRQALSAVAEVDSFAAAKLCEPE